MHRRRAAGSSAGAPRTTEAPTDSFSGSDTIWEVTWCIDMQAPQDYHTLHILRGICDFMGFRIKCQMQCEVNIRKLNMWIDMKTARNRKNAQNPHVSRLTLERLLCHVFFVTCCPVNILVDRETARNRKHLAYTCFSSHASRLLFPSLFRHLWSSSRGKQRRRVCPEHSLNTPSRRPPTRHAKHFPP